jgi:hypothetical protein
MLPHFLPKSHLKRKNENSKFNTMFKSELITKNYLLVKFGFVYLSLNIIPFILWIHLQNPLYIEVIL